MRHGAGLGGPIVVAAGLCWGTAAVSTVQGGLAVAAFSVCHFGAVGLTGVVAAVTLTSGTAPLLVGEPVTALAALGVAAVVLGVTVLQLALVRVGTDRRAAAAR